jgi:hypothetical protein
MSLCHKSHGERFVRRKHKWVLACGSNRGHGESMRDSCAGNASGFFLVDQTGDHGDSVRDSLRRKHKVGSFSRVQARVESIHGREAEGSCPC